MQLEMRTKTFPCPQGPHRQAVPAYASDCWHAAPPPTRFPFFFFLPEFLPRPDGALYWASGMPLHFMFVHWTFFLDLLSFGWLHAGQ